VHRRSFLASATFAFLTIVRIADFATTLHFDQSLSHEGNPVVFIFGGGLPALVLTGVVVWVVCTAFLFAFWRGTPLRLAKQPKRFGGFVRIWIQRVVKPRHSITDSLPGGSHWNEGLQAIRLFGLGLSWAIIFGSIAAIHAWFATRVADGGAYQHMYSTLRVGKLNLFVFLMTPAGFLVGATIFFISEYRSARSVAGRRSDREI